MTTHKQIVETRGRDSKYSSKVYVVRMVQREETELDRWFGPVDEVKRRQAYEGRKH